MEGLQVPGRVACSTKKIENNNLEFKIDAQTIKKFDACQNPLFMCFSLCVFPAKEEVFRMHPNCMARSVKNHEKNQIEKKSKY